MRTAGAGGVPSIHAGFYDFGVVDLVVVGRLLVYSSLFFSLTSAAEYVGLFVGAIEKKNAAGS